MFRGKVSRDFLFKSNSSLIYHNFLDQREDRVLKENDLPTYILSISCKNDIEY